MVSMPLICLEPMQRVYAKSTGTALPKPTIELHCTFHSRTMLSQTDLVRAGFGKRHMQRLLECEKQPAVRVWQVQGGGMQGVQGAVGSPAAARHACQ